MRTFFEFLVCTGRRRDDPSQAITMEKVPSRKPRFLPRDVIEKLFEEVYRHENNLQDRAILEVLYGSGLRRDEAGRLTLANIVERDKLRVIGKRTPSPNWSGHLGEVMLNLFEEEENGGISQGRRWAPAVHDRLQEGADRPRPPGRDYAFGACA